MVPRNLESPVRPPGYHLLRIATLSVLVAMILLSGCGRKGPLDPPPGSTFQPPSSNTQVEEGDNSTQPNVQSTFGQDGRPIAPRGVKKKLPADALID